MELKPLANIFNNHKDYYAYISKFGKNIEKNFNKKINSVFEPHEFDDKIIQQAIAENLIREGKFECEEMLCEEAGLALNESLKEQFLTLKKLMEAVDEHNLDVLIEWAEQNKAELESIGSSLLFFLHRTKYI